MNNEYTRTIYNAIINLAIKSINNKNKKVRKK